MHTTKWFLAFLFFVLFPATNASAQGSRMTSASNQAEADQPQRRALWMRRVAPPGESVAALRLQAHQQKKVMQAERAAQLAVAGPLPQDAGTAWVSLGPAPLASDATGIGFQDY